MHTLSHLLDKSIGVLKSGYGLILTLIFSLINYVGDDKLAFTSVFFAIVLDMIWGIIASIKRGGFVLSYLGRETIIKLGAYMGVMLMVLNVERSLNQDWLPFTCMIGGLICACEFISISANVLIVKPDFPFFRIFTKYLQGEINSKLGFDASKYLKKNDKRSAKKDCYSRNTEEY